MSMYVILDAVFTIVDVQMFKKYTNRVFYETFTFAECEFKDMLHKLIREYRVIACVLGRLYPLLQGDNHSIRFRGYLF